MADVNITITVPDAWVNRTLTALNGMADKNIQIGLDRGFMSYRYDAKKPEETNIVFAKRAFVEMIKNHIKAFEFSEDQERYATDISSVEPASVDVPDGILT
jgi:hypothetical protein